MRKIIVLIAILGLLTPSTSLGVTYGSNFFVGGTAAADGFLGGFPPSQAFDNTTSTSWYFDNTYPNWISYDLGVGVTKKAGKIDWAEEAECGGRCMKDFNYQVSSDDSTWYNVFTGVASDNQVTIESFIFTPTSTAYRYHRMNITSNNLATNVSSIGILRAFEEVADTGLGRSRAGNRFIGTGISR